jgi:ATP-dependent Clp protease protease subunit
MLRYNSIDRSIFLTGEIKASTATALITKLLCWDGKNNDPIKLYINSGGGEVQSGLFAIYDVLQSLRSTIETFCVGEACSSAAVLIASGSPGQRYIFPNANMMIHPPSSEISGTKNEISSYYQELQLLDSKIWNILAKHTKQKATKISKDCQQDKYFSAKEALEYGLVDAIISPIKKMR